MDLKKPDVVPPLPPGSASETFRIDSNESEGAFNEFIEDQIKDYIDQIINEGDLGQRGSEVIVEMDDIDPPTFVYGDGGAGGRGRGQGPGSEKGKLSFGLPFNKFMELVADRLRLPNLIKEGRGKIKEISYEFKTFGPVGVILDKKRTFRQALKVSIASGLYKPEEKRPHISIRRRDKRFKLPERVEKPRYKAVVFYMGDISYSTYGARLEMEKRLVNFIHNWLDYNYGVNHVEHRFFVHDIEAYEVCREDFYQVSNTGGTRASIVFKLVSQIAFNEYDPESTNFYGFYFGDGELFGNDTNEIVEIIDSSIRPIFSRLGIVEIKPSHYSQLCSAVNDSYPENRDRVVRTGIIKENRETLEIIKQLFRGEDEKHQE